MDKKIKQIKSIIAVSAQESLLTLPVIRILIKQYENVVVGHCLDFDIHVHYQGNDFKEGVEFVFNEISNISISKILRHLQDGTEDTLFDNSLPLGEAWDEFLNELRKSRITKLRQQYNKLKTEAINTAISKWECMNNMQAA